MYIDWSPLRGDSGSCMSNKTWRALIEYKGKYEVSRNKKNEEVTENTWSGSFISKYVHQEKISWSGDSSVGRASDWRSEGRVLDPHLVFLLPPLSRHLLERQFFFPWPHLVFPICFFSYFHSILFAGFSNIVGIIIHISQQFDHSPPFCVRFDSIYIKIMSFFKSTR